MTSGLAMYDTMRYIRAPVHTLCMGTARSMGSFLLMAGEPGERAALPNASILIHQPSGGFQGQATDMQIHAGIGGNPDNGDRQGFLGGRWQAEIRGLRDVPHHSGKPALRKPSTKWSRIDASRSGWELSQWPMVK